MRSSPTVLRILMTAVILGCVPTLALPTPAVTAPSPPFMNVPHAETPASRKSQTQAVRTETGTPSWELISTILSASEAVYDSLRDKMLIEQGDNVWEMPLSNPGRWSQVKPLNTPPGTLVAHAYDSKRDRILSIRSQGELWSLTLGSTPTWTKLPIPASSPTTGVLAALYDHAQDRLVVLGTGSQAWALFLAEDSDWNTLVVAGTSPSLTGETFVYDAARARVVVFGGWNPSPSVSGSNTTWTFTLGDTARWDTLACVGTRPIGRANHGAIYDPQHDQMVIFGGNQYRPDGHNCIAYLAPGTWALSFAANQWTQLSSSAPGTHEAHAHDSFRDRILEFGGPQICQGYDGATRAFDLSLNSGWSVIAPPPSPSAGDAVSLIDSNRQAFVVVQDATVWRMPFNSLGDWALMSTGGGGPPAFEVQDAVYDPVRDRVLALGQNNVWSLAAAGPTAWAQSVSVPSDLGLGYTATYDPSQDRVIAIGSSVYSLNLNPEPSWSVIIPPDQMPIKRSGHTAVYDPARYRIVVFGGSDPSGTEQNDTWAFSLDSLQWRKLLTGYVAPRREHQAIYDPTRDRMLIWNGQSFYCCGYYPIMYDAESLSFSDGTWQSEPYGASPCTDAAAVYDQLDDRILVVGGQTYPTQGTGNCQQALMLSLGGTVSADPVPRAPSRLALVAPNPAQGPLWFRFSVSARQRVLIDLFDMRGRLVRRIYDANCEPGAHSVQWDEAQSLDPGIYIYSISMGGDRFSGKLVKVR